MTITCYRCEQPYVAGGCACSDNITLVHGDCREVLPLPSHTMDSVALILADPPYGVNYSSSSRSVNARAVDYAVMEGDSRPYDPAFILSLARPTILWGANHYASRLPNSPTWLIWDKRPGGQVNDSADCELAWSNLGGPARAFRHLWMGMLRDSERKRPSVHPTQKPRSLMLWCIGLAKDGLVIDPYAGSGPVGRACKDLGRKCLMIEIEEKYVKIAAERLRQEILF